MSNEKKMLSDQTKELIEELGKIPMETIENVEKLQAELESEGYISYLSPDTDYLVVEKA